MKKLDEVIKKVSSKDIRLILNWRGKLINFCSMDFRTDGTFIFTSKFHNDTNLRKIEIGTSKLLNHNFFNSLPEKAFDINKGFHISLHPKAQMMHFREHYPGPILDKRSINWFPVTKPFNLLLLYSPPLDLCRLTTKQSPFFAPIPHNYNNSILLKVDIFPRDVKEHIPDKNSVWIFWGYCPNYLIRASFILINQRTPALLYWPQDSVLKL